jgi:hypothetical protein
MGHHALHNLKEVNLSGDGPMVANDCRKYAGAFVERAEHESSGALKMHLLTMAHAWVTLAELRERLNGAMPSEPTEAHSAE